MTGGARKGVGLLPGEGRTLQQSLWALSWPGSRQTSTRQETSVELDWECPSLLLFLLEQRCPQGRQTCYWAIVSEDLSDLRQVSPYESWSYRPSMRIGQGASETGDGLTKKIVAFYPVS